MRSRIRIRTRIDSIFVQFCQATWRMGYRCKLGKVTARFCSTERSELVGSRTKATDSVPHTSSTTLHRTVECALKPRCVGLTAQGPLL
jgi:hypothetical protein